MKNFVTLLLLISTNLLAQDTIYLDKELKEVPYDFWASYYKLIEKKDDKFHEKILFLDGNIKSIKVYSDYENKILDGVSLEYYANGRLAKKVSYAQGKLHGEQLYYWENNNIKRRDIYVENIIIEGNCFNIHGSDTVYYPVELMPVFPGGEDAMWKFISEKLIYPTELKDNLISGNAKVSFIIDKNGQVNDIKILSSTHAEFGNELRRVVSLMPVWTPGIREGENVSVTYTIPLSFVLK